MKNGKTSRRGQKLTEVERTAIVASCIAGKPKHLVAKDFGIRAESVSRLLAKVRNESTLNQVTSWRENLDKATNKASETMLKAVGKEWHAARDHLKGVGVYGETSRHQVDGQIIVKWLGDDDPVDSTIDITPESDECRGKE